MARRLNREVYHAACEGCQRAAEMLKAAGFELRQVSMRTESCYYGWPGFPWTLRVAAHRRGKAAKRTLDNCVATITVSLTIKMVRGGGFTVPATRLRQQVAEGIGEYFLRSARVADGYAGRLKPDWPDGSGSIPDARTNKAPVAEQQTHSA